MTGNKLTAEELRKLAREWFSDAREKSARDDAEVAAWKKQQRKWTGTGDGPSGFGGDGTGCGGGDGGGGD